MEVLTTYCKVVSETSVNVVDPQLFITSLIKTLPKSIFIILETPTLFEELSPTLKFEILFKALKLSPTLSHIIQFGILLPQLTESQLSLLTALIRPKTLTFNCISMINDSIKYDLYDLYVKVTLLEQLPIINNNPKEFISLIQSLQDPLFNFDTTLHFLITQNHFIYSSLLLYHYHHYEYSIELLLQTSNQLSSNSTFEENSINNGIDNNINNIIDSILLTYILEQIPIQELNEILISNNELNTSLLKYIFDKESNQFLVSPNVITLLNINYFSNQPQPFSVCKKDYQFFLDKIVPTVEGTTQRLVTSTKTACELLLYCPKKHKYTLQSYEQKMKSLIKKYPTHPIIQRITKEKMSLNVIKEKDFSNGLIKLECPLCLKKVIEKTD